DSSHKEAAQTGPGGVAQIALEPPRAASHYAGRARPHGKLGNGLTSTFFASATATALHCTVYRTSNFRSNACRPTHTSSSSTTKPASGNPSRPFLPTKATLPRAQTPPNAPSSAPRTAAST